MKKRAAIYALFSSDMQRDRSIEDQIALCRGFADRNGLAVVEIYQDRARSGASLLGRDGIMALMDQARTANCPFDVVVVEALDRLSRDREDLAGLYKRLSFADIEIQAVHDGRADQVQIGIRGLVGSLFLQDLAHKVRRGMEGVVRDGRNAGGRAYGYRPVPGRPGELVVEEAEAAIVRRIFDAYLAGSTPREIAGDLKRDKVAPPRGRYWAAATINGNRQRGHGIIQNPLYAGRIVWNRVKMVKDPDTGRRVSRPNPESEHRTSEAPHLAIVPDATFNAAQARKAERGGERPQDRRKPRHMLSGLLRCGCCGAGMSVKDRDHGRVRIMCTQAKEARSCENRRPYYLDAIERSVVTGLRDQLADRDAIALYVWAYNDERRKLAGDALANRSKLEARLAAADGEVNRTLYLLIRGVASEDRAAPRIRELEAEIVTIKAELAVAEKPPAVVSVHPAALREYLAAVDRLHDLVRDGMADGAESAKALRDLVEAVVVYPPENGQVPLEVKGRVTDIVGPDAFPAGRGGD